MWHFLFKTTNLITGEYYIGVHQSFDMYFGRKGEGQWDPFCGCGDRILESVEKYGRRAHVVESIFCHTDKAEVLRKYKEIKIDFNDPLCLNGMRAQDMDPVERARKISEALIGYKQSAEHIAKKNKTHTLKRWVNNGKEDRYILKTEPIPEGFKEGRMFRPRNRS